MKRTFLYLFVIAALAMVLPSCLGDNESSYSGNREFAVINQTTTGIKYAAVGSSMGGFGITWDGIDEYSVNDAVLLTYKVNMSNIVGGTNVLKAEYASVDDGEWFKVADQKTVTTDQVADTTKQANSAFFKTFNLNRYSSNTFFSDRWLFTYSVTKKDGEVFTPRFYYDATKQVQKDKKPLPENTAIVDVVFMKTGTPTDGATAKTEEKMFVANMTNLRYKLDPHTTNLTVVKTIWFRIMKEDAKAPDGYTLTYIQNVGSLSFEKAN